MTDEIISLLKNIKSNQETEPAFNVGGVLSMLLGAAIGYVIALSLSNAFIVSFKAIPLGPDNGIVGSWIYAIFMLIIGIFLLWVILAKLRPFLVREFNKKTN